MISWSTQKQKTVAASSCEAEYMAGFEAAKEAIWLRMLLDGIDKNQRKSTIACDNTATINLSEDPSLHYRVKHVDKDYHFLRERVQSGELDLSYIPTNDNPADAFTKAAMPKDKFVCFRNMMGLR
jgi:hypothetical protein